MISRSIYMKGTPETKFFRSAFELEYQNFDQVIAEYVDKFGNPSWVHVSKSKIGNRGEVLVKLKNRYIKYSEYSIGMI